MIERTELDEREALALLRGRVLATVAHNACLDFLLPDGRTLTLWEGSYDYPRTWDVAPTNYDVKLPDGVGRRELRAWTTWKQAQAGVVTPGLAEIAASYELRRALVAMASRDLRLGPAHVARSQGASEREDG